MADNQPLNENSPAVQTHLTMMQGVINRMAENSRSCKVWCVTLVAAVLVLVARDRRSRSTRCIALGADIALPGSWTPTTWHWSGAFIRSFRTPSSSKAHDDKVCKSDLYAVAPKGSSLGRLLWAMFLSFSVLPFYLAVAAAVLLVVAGDPLAKTESWSTTLPSTTCSLATTMRSRDYKK